VKVETKALPMPVRVSTDRVHPAERHAFWTEAICHSFSQIETQPLGATRVSGRFEFVEFGAAKLVRFDSSPQCYTRSARLVSRDGADDFMFDFQRRGQSSLTQAGNEGTMAPGFGMLYDARRPFEDRLYGPEQRAEVLVVMVPAAALLHAFPDAERFCARPIPLGTTLSRAVAVFIRNAVDATEAHAGQDEADIAAYLAALLRTANGTGHQLSRSSLFGLVEAYLRANIAAIRPASAIAGEFGISERTLHRIFADRDTSFERHLHRLRVELFRRLLGGSAPHGASIADLATQCGFADAAHATRSFKAAFNLTPRDFRSAIGALQREPNL
jgi:AraC family transcriptional regulator, positive regulator of tynA and feaB